MKKRNIILILILIVLSIFLMQYWSKKQDQAEKERIEQLEIERVRLDSIEKAEQLEIERVILDSIEKAEQLEIERVEKEKLEQLEIERLRLERIEKEKTSFTWHTDINKAINLSVQSSKPLFFFFTGSDWCGWCIKLQKEVFFLPEFKKWATKNVILVELDFPRRTPISDDLKKQNRELATMFGVRGYPTVWLVTPTISDGKVNFNKLGSQGYVRGGPSAWIAGANKILKKQ